METVIALIVSLFVSDCLIERAYFKETGAHLTFFDSFFVPGLIIIIAIFISYLFPPSLYSRNTFSPEIIIISAIIAVLVGLIFVVPAMVKKHKADLILENERRRNEAEAQSAIIEQAVKKALAERDSEKAVATEKGAKESLDSKA